MPKPYQKIKPVNEEGAEGEVHEFVTISLLPLSEKRAKPEMQLQKRVLQVPDKLVLEEGIKEETTSRSSLFEGRQKIARLRKRPKSSIETACASNKNQIVRHGPTQRKFSSALGLRAESISH